MLDLAKNTKHRFCYLVNGCTTNYVNQTGSLLTACFQCVALLFCMIAATLTYIFCCVPVNKFLKFIKLWLGGSNSLCVTAPYSHYMH